MVVLAVIAWRSPDPGRSTDRQVYEATASRTVVPDCTDIHCFRVLVAWTLGSLPGESVVKWKTYAVLANTGAAAAVLILSLAWGLSLQAAVMAAVLSAFGFGSLYTLHDPFTSDPLMYALAPFVVFLLLRERVAFAAGVGVMGVMAKEFVAAPLFIGSAASWLEGRRDLALRVLAAANLSLIAWLILQLTLIVRFNYGYGNNPSTHLLNGGYLLPWLAQLSPRVALSAIINEFGALWILAPAGLLLAPVVIRRFAWLSLPVAALFAYVQQPDRALWNFHFLVTPLAALILERVPVALAWAIIVLFASANLRAGAQLTDVPNARFALAASGLLAIVSVGLAMRHQREAARVGAARV
jgi:hypothetical protein